MLNPMDTHSEFEAAGCRLAKDLPKPVFVFIQGDERAKRRTICAGCAENRACGVKVQNPLNWEHK